LAKTINILVQDSVGNGVFGAKGYIGTKSGARLYDANKGGISSPDGEMTLSVGNLLTPQYIWVKEPTKNFEAKQLYRSSKKTPYKFEIPKATQEIVETIVRAKRPTPPQKRNKTTQYLIIGGVLLLGVVIILISRKKNKK